MAIRTNWRLYVLSPAILALCACASAPQIPDCPKPLPPNPDLLVQPPPPGEFHRKMDALLEKGRTLPPISMALPTDAMKSQPSFEDSSNLF